MRPLAILGNVNVDLIMGPVTPWPQSGTEIIVDHDELRVGGAAGNTALAWIALGTDFVIASSVGKDKFGEWLAGEFGDHSKDWPVHTQSTTLSVGVTHPDGERTFLTTKGHLPHFALADAMTVLSGEALRGGVLLLCGSFLMDAMMADYPALFDWADRHDIALALDTGWPLDGWTDANRALATGWLRRCRIALLNEVETTTLTGKADPEEAARALKAAMPADAIVVVKRGPDGAIALDRQGRYISASAPKVDVIDTIGAGDVFNAGFLTAMANGNDLDVCLQSGVSIASCAISTHPRSYSNDKQDTKP